MTAMLRVTQVESLDDVRVRVTFNDGVVREVDCSFLMHGTLGEPLRDPAYFAQVRVDEEARTLVWSTAWIQHLSSCTATTSRPPGRGGPAPYERRQSRRRHGCRAV